MGTPVEGIPSTSEEVVQGIPSDQGNTPGLNPAWNDVLALIPESLHDSVTSHFRQWDNAANSRIETLNSEVKKYEDYAPFVEHGIGRDDLVEGLNLVHTITNEPQKIYDALRDAYPNLTHAEAVTAVETISEEVSDTSTPNPRLEQLEQNFTTLAQAYLTKEQNETAKVAEAEIEREFTEAKKKYGDFDEHFVMDRIVAKTAAGEDYSIDQAANDYISLKDSILQQNKRPAPMILGAAGSGGLPSNAVDVTKLSDGDTKKLVATMAAQLAQQ